MRTACVVAIALLLPASGLAQPPIQPYVDGMKKLGFLEGTWEGEGWMQFGPGKREEFVGTEVVKYKLGGTILLVEGLHYEKLSGGKKGKVVHQALGVFSHHFSRNAYSFHAWRAGAPGREYSARLRGDGIEWSFQDPRSKRHIRFFISVKDGQWNEVGESSADKKTWHKFFEMTLKKK